MHWLRHALYRGIETSETRRERAEVIDAKLDEPDGGTRFRAAEHVVTTGSTKEKEDVVYLSASLG